MPRRFRKRRAKCPSHSGIEVSIMSMVPRSSFRCRCPGTGPALGLDVLIDLTSLTSGRRIRLESKILCKVLHLVGFHGWRPERLQTPAPSASWNTEIIVPHILPYLSGALSTSDAAGLAAGLRTMLASESLGLPPEIHYASLALLAISERGPFEVVPVTEAIPTGPVGKPASHSSCSTRSA
jgi:hypothetical protein